MQSNVGQLIAGVDEVGRGSWAGDVMAAAVILDSTRPINGLKDSKLLTSKKREILCDAIKSKCLAWAIGRSSVQEIEHLNILQATLLAMQRAICALHVKPDHIQVDGHVLPQVACSIEGIIGGDYLIPAISAASIVAKVTRDREMAAYDALYPGYNFALHKGYGTAKHLAVLTSFGVTPIHRSSFSPIKKILARC